MKSTSASTRSTASDHNWSFVSSIHAWIMTEPTCGVAVGVCVASGVLVGSGVQMNDTGVTVEVGVSSTKMIVATGSGVDDGRLIMARSIPNIIRIPMPNKSLTSLIPSSRFQLLSKPSGFDCFPQNGSKRLGNATCLPTSHDNHATSYLLQRCHVISVNPNDLCNPTFYSCHTNMIHRNSLFVKYHNYLPNW